MDFIVDKANELGLWIGFLPTWGRYWHDTRDNQRPIFNRENAAAYGEWLGKRYRDKKLIWVLGGDRTIDNDEQKEIIRAMAGGLHKGDGGAHLRTFHPPGGNGSSTWFHDDDWLDFNMRQNGHVVEFTGRYSATRADYDRKPIKPVVDGEPIYEDHPVSFKAKELGHSIAADIRRPLYWNLFTGACGVTYGHHSVWQMWSPGKNPINNPLMPWSEAIDQPGAGQAQHLRWLLESRPMLSRIPDQEVIVTDRVPTSVPGAGRYFFAATRDSEGTLRDGVLARGAKVQGADEQGQRPASESLVVQPSRRQGQGGSAHFPTTASASSRRPTTASTWIGCWCWTRPRKTTRRRVQGSSRSRFYRARGGRVCLSACWAAVRMEGSESRSSKLVAEVARLPGTGPSGPRTLASAATGSAANFQDTSHDFSRRVRGCCYIVVSPVFLLAPIRSPSRGRSR